MQEYAGVCQDCICSCKICYRTILTIANSIMIQTGVYIWQQRGLGGGFVTNYKEYVAFDDKNISSK